MSFYEIGFAENLYFTYKQKKTQRKRRFSLKIVFDVVAFVFS
ncbi:hypothetical protein MPF_1035 [Methanohalophilus portucalensis FDF-1]|uniref:Uncharacterized protein n=1 Tax=Methanohalophilus portucalensis FDF-1 TaxID=523843 RepID=A0A1L9C429_9EURY|nr:hypothetical protein MPF_1035 [Methanohalophilus portucalensis FDF-1]